MSDAIEFAPLQPTPAAPLPAQAELERLNDVSVEVSVEIGRTRMSLGDALALGPGSVIGLHRLAGEPVDVLVNGKVIARGEVVVLDEEFGLRVTDVAGTGTGLVPAPQPAPAPAPQPEPEMAFTAEPVTDAEAA